MATQKNDDKTRTDEARRTLERVNQESEVLGNSSFARVSDRVIDHMTAADGDQEDRVEVWAKRTARVLSVIAFVALAIWLFGFLTR